MSRQKRPRSGRCSKSITIPLFDIHEDGYHIGLNHIVQLQRYSDSPNVSLQSRLQTCKKSVCVSTVIRGVFV